MPEEDYQRYCKQLEIMRGICAEFDGQSSSERILELMQQLQQYGQPPEDLAGENVSALLGRSGHAMHLSGLIFLSAFRSSKLDCPQACKT